MNKAGSQSFGSEHDPYGPTAYDASPPIPPSPPKRQGSEIHSAVLYDVPLEYEGFSMLESDERLNKGPGIQRLRRTMKFARVAFLLAVAFVVAIFLVFIPRGQHKKTFGDTGQNQEASSSVQQGPSSPLVSSSAQQGPFCFDRFTECVGQRLSNSEELETGEAICSGDHHHFMLGMDVNGTLVWQDCVSGEFEEYYHGASGYSFEMNSAGDFIVRDANGRLQKKWDFSGDMKAVEGCFSTHGIAYDCPFLHIHKEGKVVLNWEDDVGAHSKGISKFYDFGE